MCIHYTKHFVSFALNIRTQRIHVCGGGGWKLRFYFDYLGIFFFAWILQFEMDNVPILKNDFTKKKMYKSIKRLDRSRNKMWLKITAEMLTDCNYYKNIQKDRSKRSNDIDQSTLDSSNLTNTLNSAQTNQDSYSHELKCQWQFTHAFCII